MTQYFSKKFLSFYNDTQLHAASMPSDVIPVSTAVYTAMKSAMQNGKVIGADASGNPMAVEPVIPVPPPLNLAQTITLYSSALSAAINAVAISWQYDNITSAATYVNSPIQQFANEAKVLIHYRDTAWINAQNLLARVQAGTSPVPATTQAFLAIVLPPTPTRPVH